MILTGTGHRPNKIGGYGVDIARHMELLAEECLVELKPDVVISGMALGWDQALAFAAHHQKIDWWAYVPFKNQDKMWPEKSKQVYAQLLLLANRVVIVCDGEYAPWKMQKRNEAMIDQCDTVLALWNGSGGGTANCVAYANKIGRPIINVWEKWSRYEAGKAISRNGTHLSDAYRKSTDEGPILSSRG